MTNQQGAPEALRPITRYEVVDCIDSKHVPAVIPNGAGPWVRYEDHIAAMVEAQQPATHVQDQAEIEHVAGDVSKNGAESNMAQQPAPSAEADLIAALEEARSAINSMKVEAETAGQGDEQMMLEACETISNEGLQADMAIRAALASAPKPSSTPQADSQPAQLRDYPPLPDFETVEQHIYGACRRYITQDMLEPIHNLIRDVIDADRAARATTSSVLEDATLLERERICAAIKAEDDYCVDHGDYMLDSDDCIKIVRGEWVRPDFSVDAARKQGEKQ